VAAADVPAWAWAAFAGFVLAVLALDLFVLHRRARQVSLAEAGAWSAVWVALGLGFGGLLWWWQGSGTGQAYLAGYLIEKSLSVDNILVFAFIFSALQIPPRYQQRVLMLGILAALVMRGAFIAGGITLLDRFHPVIYVFGAVLLYAAIRMLRGGTHPQPQRSPALRGLRRILPTSDRLHGQRFLVKEGGRVLATPPLHNGTARPARPGRRTGRCGPCHPRGPADRVAGSQGPPGGAGRGGLGGGRDRDRHAHPPVSPGTARRSGRFC